MGYRSLEIHVRWAKHLKNVNFLSRMHVYVVVSISGDSKTNDKYRTTADRSGGTNPTWDFPISFLIDDSTAEETLIFQLRCERSSRGDKDVGEVRIPVKHLLGSESDKPQFVNYEVRNPSGKCRGKFFFSYKWIDMETDALTVVPEAAGTCKPVAAKIEDIVMAYPYPAWPRSDNNIGYLLSPPPPGYPIERQKSATAKNNNGFGLRLGAGILGGALGGFLIADMLSDAGINFSTNLLFAVAAPLVVIFNYFCFYE